MKAYLISILLILIAGSSQAQLLTHRPVELEEFIGKGTLLEYNKMIYKAAIDGKITAYRHDSLTSIYIIEEIKKLGTEEEVIEFYPDPENYPDYYIDSVIINPFNPNHIKGNSIGEVWFLNSLLNKITVWNFAFAINYQPSIGGVEFSEQPLFWIKLDDLKKVFNDEQVSRIKDAIIKEVQRFSGDSGTVSTNYNKNLPIEFYAGNYTIRDFNLRFLEAVYANKIKVYKNDRFDTTLNEDELSKIRPKEVIKWYYDPVNFGNYYIDTLINIDFHRLKLDNNISFELFFNEKDNTYTIYPNGISVNWLNEVEFPHLLFWIKFTDLKKILTKAEVNVLMYAIYRTTVNQHDQFFDYEDE